MVGGGRKPEGRATDLFNKSKRPRFRKEKKIRYTDLTKKNRIFSTFRRSRRVCNITPPESTVPENWKERSGPCGPLSTITHMRVSRTSLRHRQPDTYLVPSRVTRRRAPYSCCWTCCCCTSWAPLRYSGRRRMRNGLIRVKYGRRLQQSTLGITILRDTDCWQDTGQTNASTRLD